MLQLKCIYWITQFEDKMFQTKAKLYLKIV